MEFIGTESTLPGLNTPTQQSVIQSAAAEDQTQLASDLDDFLTLLTAQLANQDPLDPLDSSEFTNQLVQFSSVEQQIQTNSNLETLIAAQEQSRLAEVANYVSRFAEVESNVVQVIEGGAEFNYTLLDQASSNLITVVDSNGQTLFSAQGNLTRGKHGIVWDGTDLNGNKVNDGLYQLIVSPLDADGLPIDVVTTTIGRISGVSYVGEEPVVQIGGLDVSLDQIISLREQDIRLTTVNNQIEQNEANTNTGEETSTGTGEETSTGEDTTSTETTTQEETTTSS